MGRRCLSLAIHPRSPLASDGATSQKYLFCEVPQYFEHPGRCSRQKRMATVPALVIAGSSYCSEWDSCQASIRCGTGDPSSSGASSPPTLPPLFAMI
ncbi:uncharacterized protein ColSpa_09048 [Colletotrichum spaethianum]|uniref:Uncharacterized protein n=1 Tax=Colletotrichum spaethianum TaxID=700344 RepID=A0AA37PAX7_9PEZI|nr:uncharacterized protein ColSpa_09048 [Colletotrichum spaethianum]GKT48867.1 hypothetical protein ColSpa_09048 [Colletotrichum spaethianum]